MFRKLFLMWICHIMVDTYREEGVSALLFQKKVFIQVFLGVKLTKLSKINLHYI